MIELKNGYHLNIYYGNSDRVCDKVCVGKRLQSGKDVTPPKGCLNDLVLYQWWKVSIRELQSDIVALLHFWFKKSLVKRNQGRRVLSGTLQWANHFRYILTASFEELIWVPMFGIETSPSESNSLLWLEKTIGEWQNNTVLVFEVLKVKSQVFFQWDVRNRSDTRIRSSCFWGVSINWYYWQCLLQKVRCPSN